MVARRMSEVFKGLGGGGGTRNYKLTYNVGRGNREGGGGVARRMGK